MRTRRAGTRDESETIKIRRVSREIGRVENAIGGERIYSAKKAVNESREQRQGSTVSGNKAAKGKVPRKSKGGRRKGKANDRCLKFEECV